MKQAKKLLALAIVGILGVTAKIVVKVGIYGSLLAISHFLHMDTDTDAQKANTSVAQGKPAANRPQQGGSAARPAPSNQPPVLIGNGPIGAAPKAAAANAVAAANAQLASQTGQEVPAPKGAAAPPPQSSPQAPPQQSAAAPAPQNPPAPQVVQQGDPAADGGKPASSATKGVPTIASAPPGLPAGRATSRRDSITARRPPDSAMVARSLVMREVYDYGRDSRRDPFVSLMTTGDLRPTITDLRLTGILYDLSGSRPIAVLRDVAGGQWRVTTGMTLGRMRVALIRPKAVIFTIEEFGFNRQDSLLLGDTTRVRVR
jgi:hypothetical protein